MDISSTYTKFRRDCGRQPLFSEHGPEMCDSIATNPPVFKQFILRNPVHQPTQNAPVFSHHFINTIRASYASTGANHAEGGWPKDVQIHDPEATQRYRRKVEKEDGYIHCVMNLCDPLEHYILQNNAIDMYQTYYSEMESMEPLERSSARIVNVYRHPERDQIPVSSFSFQPKHGHMFATTYLDVDVNRKPRGHIYSYIWNVENANEPFLRIIPPVPLVDLQYSERERSVLIGALLDGRVAVWDSRQSSAPQLLCPPHVAHRDLVRNVLFINSKSGQEFFSGSSDGSCKWWDIRNMEDFTEEVIIDIVRSSTDTQSMEKANGVSVIEYEHTIPTRYMVGTENGLVVGGNRKGKTPLEKLPSKFEAHTGVVRTVERNPGYLKNFLTVGDWTARVWSEDCRESAIIWTPPQRYKFTAGTWSPARISMMLLTQSNGVLGVWDLLRRQHEPALSLQLCPEALRALRMQHSGVLCACGSEKGNVFMVELSSHLCETGKHDKLYMTNILEREGKREHILEARMREIRLKLKQAEEGSPAHSASDVDPTVGDRDLHDAAAEYFTALKREMLVDKA